MPKLSISTIKPVEAIDAYLDPGLFQGLIESTNTEFRLFTSNRLGFHDLYPDS